MTPDQKYWIDSASYMALLRKWRFDTGEEFQDPDYYQHFSITMAKKKKDVDHVAISKQVGWVKS